MQKGMKFNDVAVTSVKGNDYRILFWYISKDEAYIENADLTEKVEQYET